MTKVHWRRGLAVEIADREDSEKMKGDFCVSGNGNPHLKWKMKKHGSWTRKGEWSHRFYRQKRGILLSEDQSREKDL